MRKLSIKLLLCFLLVSLMDLSSPLLAQASKLKVNNESPSKRDQVKRMHPHALKLILQGRKKEAIEYLEKTSEKAVNSKHTKMLMDMALDRSNAWKLDAKTWPWERTLPNTSLKKDEASDRFTIAFGGGAGYVPENERICCLLYTSDAADE